MPTSSNTPKKTGTQYESGQATNQPPLPEWIADAISQLPPFLSVLEAASALRVSVRTIRRALAGGHLRALKVSGGGHTTGPVPVRIPRGELGRYLAATSEPALL